MVLHKMFLLLVTTTLCIYVCIADLTLESFPSDFEEILYWHGVDRENRNICKLFVVICEQGC